jgi:hypothetical protein
MIKHVGEEVNIEHFFAVLSLSMFSRYSINATFDNVGEQTSPSFTYMCCVACLGISHLKHGIDESLPWSTLPSSSGNRETADAAFRGAWLPASAAQLSELTSRGSNVIGEHMVLGLPIYYWIPRVR